MFPSWMLSDECKIVNRLITAILDRGFRISIHDGEEYVLTRCATRNLIQHETCQTDETTYVIWDNSRTKRVGWIWLIHGNGEDVISDYSDNTICEEIVNDTYA